jgi:hypothetical protein
MTVETKCFVTLDDIRGMQIECNKCHLKLNIGLDDAARQRVRLCPGCNEIWMEEDSRQQTAFGKLAEVMSAARRVIADSKFIVSLEIPCPEMKR